MSFSIINFSSPGKVKLSLFVHLVTLLPVYRADWLQQRWRSYLKRNPNLSNNTKNVQLQGCRSLLESEQSNLASSDGDSARLTDLNMEKTSVQSNGDAQLSPQTNGESEPRPQSGKGNQSLQMNGNSEQTSQTRKKSSKRIKSLLSRTAPVDVEDESGEEVPTSPQPRVVSCQVTISRSDLSLICLSFLPNTFGLRYIAGGCLQWKFLPLYMRVLVSTWTSCLPLGI